MQPPESRLSTSPGKGTQSVPFVQGLERSPRINIKGHRHHGIELRTRHGEGQTGMQHCAAERPPGLWEGGRNSEHPPGVFTHTALEGVAEVDPQPGVAAWGWGGDSRGHKKPLGITDVSWVTALWVYIYVKITKLGQARWLVPVIAALR